MVTQVGERAETWWKLIGAHALLIERVGHDLAAATSLSLASYNVLRLLHETAGGRLRLSELAKAVHLTRSGVTRLANRLERERLLRREGCARDRRESWAVLTDRGRDRLRRARVVFIRAMAKHFGSCLSDGETKSLNVVLSRIVAAAESGGDCQ